LRKAGEGQDLDPKWKKGMAYKKEKEVNQDDDEEEVRIKRATISIVSQ